MWRDFTEREQGPGARGWLDVDAAIRRFWREGAELNKFKIWSSSQVILLVAPLVLSALHLLMLGTVMWSLGGLWQYAAIAAGVTVCFGFAVVVFACWPILKKQAF